MEINRRHFIASLGGVAAVKVMSCEAKAEALESYMIEQLTSAAPGQAAAAKKFPTVADLEAQIETRNYRRGVGSLFLTTRADGKVRKLTPMPAKPTLLDYFTLRYPSISNHVLQSANLAKKNGMSEEIILACLL